MDIFKIFTHSVFDCNACKIAVLQWRWKVVFYFLLLSIISAIGISISAYKPLDEIYNTTINNAIETLKTIKIQDGKIITPDGNDVLMKNPDGSLFAIASQNYIDANKTKGLLFSLEKDRITIYMPDGSESFIKAKDYQPIFKQKEINASALIPSKEVMLYFFLPIISLFFAIFMNLMYALMLTMACFILSRTMFPRLTIWQSSVLALIALTPSTLLDFVSATIFGQAVFGFIYALISGGVAYYLLKKFAVSENTPDTAN